MHKVWLYILVSLTLAATDQHAAYPGSAGKAVDCGEPAPPVGKVKAPSTPLIFEGRKGYDRQMLSLTYRRAGSVDFEYHRTGRCERHEKGTAVLKPCWWLGLETNEHENGEAYFVQEYVFERSGGCEMYLRIAEDDWKAASVKDSGCSKSCPATETEMHLKKPPLAPVPAGPVRRPHS